MIARMLGSLVCAILLGACTSAGPALARGGDATHAKQFPITLRELLLLSRDATIEQVEAAIGSPPGRARFSEIPGLLETPDGYWIERVYFDGLKPRSSIVVAVGSVPLGPCYPMDKVADLTGAREPRGVSYHQTRYTLTVTRKNMQTDFIARREDDGCLGQVFFTNISQLPPRAKGFPDPAVAAHDNRSTHTKQFPISLQELLLLSHDATIEQVEAAIGSPPERARFSEIPGLLETPDGYWVVRVYFIGLKKRKSIEVIVGSVPLGPCYSMDKVADLTGAREPRGVSYHQTRYTLTVTQKNMQTDFIARHEDDGCLGQVHFSNISQLPRLTKDFSG